MGKSLSRGRLTRQRACFRALFECGSEDVRMALEWGEVERVSEVGKWDENRGWIFRWIFKLDIHLGGNWIFKTLARRGSVEGEEKSEIWLKV